MEPKPRSLGARSLSHWTTRDILAALTLIPQEWKHKMVQPLCRLFDIILKNYICILCSNQSASYWLIQKCFHSFIKPVFEGKVRISLYLERGYCSHRLDGDCSGLSQKEFNDSAGNVCRTWVLLCIYSQHCWGLTPNRVNLVWVVLWQVSFSNRMKLLRRFNRLSSKCSVNDSCYVFMLKWGWWWCRGRGGGS